MNKSGRILRFMPKCQFSNCKIGDIQYTLLKMANADQEKQVDRAVIGENTYNPNKAIYLSSTQITLNRGKTVKLDAFEVGNNELRDDLNWSSSNEDVAIVNEYALVTGVGKGTKAVTKKSQLLQVNVTKEIKKIREGRQ